ncbi:MAG: hypothetical protein AAF560_30250 [Acidobacteriota bacterium]
MTLRARPLLVWVAALGLLMPLAARAQDPAALFQFRLANPGARSLGFGGAFAALADDATAAYANPAGLVQLVEPEISAEFRVTVFPSDVTQSDRDATGLGFASFVFPRKNWAVAVYDSQLAQVDTLFLGQLNLGPLFSSGTSGSVSVRNQGLAGSYRWNEKFSIGLGVSRFEGEFSATSELSAEPPLSRFLQIRTDEDQDVTFNAGFLWHFAPGWDLGGFFRQGPSFALASDVVAGPTSEFPPPTTVLSTRTGIPLDLPNVYGLGVAYETKNGAMTASFEWDHIGPSAGFDAAEELHLGLELLVLRTSPVLALRLGLWHDPDRRADKSVVTPSLVPMGFDDWHTAIGVGVAFKSLKLDFALDQSDRVDTFSLSMVYVF